jgi:hypothetical protein
MERRKLLREYRWSSYRGYAGLEKMSSYLNSEPIQGVFQTYTGRYWKAWEYRRWVEEGLIGEHFEFNLERLKERSSRNNLARRCATTLCWDHAGLSHAEIAALLPSSNSVAQTIRRTKAQDAQTLKVLKQQIGHK